MGFKIGKIPSMGQIAKGLGELEVVINTLAPIVAAVGDAADEDVEVGMDPILQLYDLLDKASNILSQRAEIHDPSDSNNISSTGQKSRYGRTDGLWIDPTSSDGGNQNLEMYRDLSGLLTLFGVPSKLEVKPGQEEDTTQLIGDAIFANAPIAPRDLASDADPVTVIPITVSNHQNSCIVQVKHAYHDLPFGSESASNAWNAAIHVKVTTSEEFRRAQAAKSTPVTSVSADSRTNISWISNLTVDWATRVAAEDAAKVFPDIFIKGNSGYLVELNSVLGAQQLLKIGAPKGVSPAQIKANVTATIEKMAKAPGIDAVVALPAVTVTLSTIMP